MLEPVDEVELIDALKERGLRVQNQGPVTLVFEKVGFAGKFKADHIVEDKKRRTGFR